MSSKPKYKRGPRPGSQAYFRFMVWAHDGEPFKVGDVVTARVTLPGCGLVENKPHKITAVREAQLVPGRGNRFRYFYEVDSSGLPYVLFEYVRHGGPVCAHPFPVKAA